MKKIIIFALAMILSLSLFSCEKECPHTHLTASIVEPTCSEEGYTLNTCTECMEEFKTKYKLPTGHEMIETVFAPTCDGEGYTDYSCKCGYNYRSNYLPPAGHTYNIVEKVADCEHAGYKEYTCTVCKHSYKGDFVDALGHSLKESIVLPTPEGAIGYTEYSCKDCGVTYRSDYTFYSDVHGGGEVENTDVLARGIDVSVYQHTLSMSGEYSHLNWSNIKNAGIDYAILKIGSKKSGMDPVFEMNYADAKAANIDLGAYFYCYATSEEELDEEIDLLLTWLDGRTFEYPIYFDLEDPTLENPENKEMLTRFCFKFIDALRAEGYYGALYSNENWLENFLFEDILRGYCDIWYARYPTANKVTLNDAFEWNTEKYGAQLGMWQYSSTGQISGSGMPKNQTVDLNYCYKDYPTIIKKYGLNGFSNDAIVA